MKLLNFSTNDNPTVRLGIKSDQGIIDLANSPAAAKLSSNDTHGAIGADRQLLEEVAASAEQVISEESITFAPVVLNPEKIICIGLNYRLHALETGADLPETPIVFSKFNNSLAAHGETIPLATNATSYDYEVELGVVIGTEARYVSEEDALDYVFGYCTINDLSTRELQGRTSQWLLGKTMDKGMPCGPYLVTADEVGDPHQLRLTTHLNGELRQDSNTNDLIFDIRQIISYASQYFTLKPGDIIATGTPSGVILGMDPRVWMKPGDTVTVEVEGLGACTNTFIAE